MHNNRIFMFPGIIFLALMLGFAPGATADDIIPGDANGDGFANVSDAVWIINYIFTGGFAPVDMSAADVNGDCLVNISDVVMILNHIFLGNPEVLELGCYHVETGGICLRDSPDSEYVLVEVIGDDLLIYHFNAYYQCCLEYAMNYSFLGNTITAQEIDTGDLCDCYCPFSVLKSELINLQNGSYTVIVIGIEGDTLAVEQVTINDAQGLINYFDSGCLDVKSGPREGTPVYSYADGILTMFHPAAEFNCAAILIVELEQVADTLKFYESNVSNQWVYCICPFDITAQVAGLAPGQYTALVYKKDDPGSSDPVLMDSQQIVIPE